MVFINQRSNFIYFLNPKAGSSTIRCTFSFNDSGWKLLENFEYNHVLRRKIFWGHIVINEFQIISSEDLRHFTTFTFVRNPYERFYSSYLQLHKEIKYRPERWGIFTKDMQSVNYDFNEYVNQFIAKADLNKDYLWTHFRNQHLYAYGKDGYKVNFIGRVEALARDFKRLCRLLKIGPFPLQSANISRNENSSYLPYFNKNTIRFVNDFYHKDFELFGYKKVDPNDFPEKATKHFDLKNLLL